MMNAMLLILACAAPGLDKDAKAPPAKVTISADLACLHCTFGQGDHCAACLALDEKTPVLLEGKAGEKFLEARFDKKVLVAEGTLTRNKDQRLVLTSADPHLWSDKDRGVAPEKGEVRLVGKPACGHCDLKITTVCTPAFANAGLPVLLGGKMAKQCQEEEGAKSATVTGKLTIDKDGLLHLEVKNVVVDKK